VGGIVVLDRNALAPVVMPIARGYVRYGEGWPGRDAVWAAATRAGLPRRRRRVAGRTRFGFRIAGDQHSVMPRCLYWFGHWEPLLSAWVRESLSPGDTFVDVGANIGYFTMMAARAVGPSGSVVAFEPSPATRRLLEENLRRNSLDNVRIVEAAAGADDGVIPLYRAPWNNAETSTLPLPGTEHEADVRSIAVPEALSEAELARARIIKIDVEGAEPAVLEGIRRYASRLAPQTEIAVEVHVNALTPAGTSVTDLVAAFEPLGYRARWLPVDFSEAAHLHRQQAIGPRTDEIPTSELVHLILSPPGGG
jgi:FkbM family methyltransferase